MSQRSYGPDSCISPDLTGRENATEVKRKQLNYRLMPCLTTALRILHRLYRCLTRLYWKKRGTECVHNGRDVITTMPSQCRYGVTVAAVLASQHIAQYPASDGRRENCRESERRRRQYLFINLSLRVHPQLR